MLYLSEITKRFKKFAVRQDGAVTVEFVALSAVLVVIALATAQGVKTKTDAGVQALDLTVTS